LASGFKPLASNAIDPPINPTPITYIFILYFFRS
jgi:hypothetical protein